MKTIKLNIILIVLLTALYSCSDNEATEQVKTIAPIEQSFNASIVSTSAHNTMLENMYNVLQYNPNNINKNLEPNEVLDETINLFLDANKKLINDNLTRGGSECDIVDFSCLKDMILRNKLLNLRNVTRASNDIDFPDYLIQFYNLFFENEELDINNLHEEIITDINFVLKENPDLSDEEIDGLFFVAGVTFNSCEYWYENAESWIELFSEEPKTRGVWWDAVKSGTKKWAKADSSGAIAAFIGNEVLCFTTGGLAILAGAATSSAVGAWENLPFWD